MEENEYKIMRHIENTYWWFRGKQFLVEMFLERCLDKNKSSKILDIGTGTGAILELLQKYGQAYGADVSPVAIRMLAGSGHRSIVQSDAEEAIPFRSNTFSAVTCLDVLEHLENDRVLLHEMIRVCEPGGIILITVPAMRLLWSGHDEALHHKRRYSKKQLLNQIARLRCTVIKVSYFNSSLLLPIAALRKTRSLFKRQKAVKSDFYMPLPDWLNSALYLWYSIELRYLRFTNFPFGVSVLLIAQKPAYPGPIDPYNANGTA